MKNLLLLPILFLTTALAAPTYDFYSKVQLTASVGFDGSPIIYGSNYNVIDATVKIDIQARGGHVPPVYAVIPAKTIKKKLHQVRPNRGSRSQNQRIVYQGYKYNIMRGSVYGRHDDDYVYGLPFPAGKTHKITQGYNGKHTHKKKNALDFDIRLGQEICAVRSGIVGDIENRYKTGCPEERCLHAANFIWIEHEDGSAASYAHLAHNGIKVEVGQRVEKGEVIALSGNTGYAANPHLHLEIYETKRRKYQSVETLFAIDSLGNTGYLEEGKSYTRYE